MGLTIGRSKGESIILKTSDGDIEIMSLSNQTKLNIIAPKSVDIWRKELLDDNLELLPRNRTTTRLVKEGRLISVQGCESFHTPRDST